MDYIEQLTECLAAAGIGCDDMTAALELARSIPTNATTLSQINTATALLALCGDNEITPGVEETLTRSVETVDGSVAAGKRSVNFAKLSSTGTVMVNGVAVSDARPLHFKASKERNTLPAFTYTIAGGANLEINILEE